MRARLKTALKRKASGRMRGPAERINAEINRFCWGADRNFKIGARRASSNAATRNLSGISGPSGDRGKRKRAPRYLVSAIDLRTTF